MFMGQNRAKIRAADALFCSERNRIDGGEARIQSSRFCSDCYTLIRDGICPLTNPSRMQNMMSSKGMDAGWNTVSDYAGHLVDAFLFEETKRFDIKGKDYIGTPSKYYAADLGIRNAKPGFRQDEYTHLMENAIYNELRYRRKEGE